MGTREEISMWTNIAEPRVRVSEERAAERERCSQPVTEIQEVKL